MNWHEFIRERLGQITGDAARDADIVEELAQHVASRFDELCGAGATELEAVGRIEGELQASAEMARAIRRADSLRPASPVPPAFSASRLLSDLWNDARYALRLLIRCRNRRVSRACLSAKPTRSVRIPQ
jgi:hypothetical protein